MLGQWPCLRAELGLISATNNQDLHIGEAGRDLRQRPHQYVHALAWLVIAAQEKHCLTCPRVALQHRRPGKGPDIDAVGNLDRVGSECLHLPAPGQLGDRDPADDLFVPRAQHRLKDAQRQRLRGRRVEGSDDRALGHHKRQHGQTRRVGFMQVQHIEVAVDQPAPGLGIGGRAEPQPRDRTVVRNGDGLAAGHHELGQLYVR